MSLLKAFKTNDDEIQNGKWFEIKGSKFLLAHEGVLNRKASSKTDFILRQKSEALGGRVADEDESYDVEVEIFCTVYLLDWKSDELGPFSKEAALKLMREYPYLYRNLSVRASTISNYQPEQKVDKEVKK